MTQKLIIKGRLPSRNTAEYAARTYVKAIGVVGAYYKKKWTTLVQNECIVQRLKPVKRAKVTITFYEKDYKRDADNVIGGGIKYIFDGLVKARVIPNDTRKCVREYINPVELDRANPRIEVEIEEV
jgi:Holliday junction resolvase RusA-like endonuclease